MELKLSDNNDTGLRLKGDQWSAGRTELSGDANMNPGDNNCNPWDFDGVDRVYETPSISRPIDLDTVDVKKSKKDSLLVTISMYILYVLWILEIVVVVWISAQHPIDVYANMYKFSMLFSLCTLVMFVDLIIVQVYEGRKISLILWALFFSFLYPWKRGKYTGKGEGLGLICSIGYIFSVVGIMVAMYNSYSQYGMTMTADDTTRQEVVMLMDQQNSQGDRYGDMISENIELSMASYEQIQGVECITIAGMGNYTVENNIFVHYIDANFETQLIFVKGKDGQYQVAKVILGDIVLNETGARIYWRAVME